MMQSSSNLPQKRPTSTVHKAKRVYGGKDRPTKRIRLSTDEFDGNDVVEEPHFGSSASNTDGTSDSNEYSANSMSSSPATSPSPVEEIRPMIKPTNSIKATGFTLSTRRKPLFRKTNAVASSNIAASITSTETTSKSKRSSLIARSQPKPDLVQMQIDIDGIGAPRINCKECGMSYVPSSSEDEAIHRKYHARTIEGMDFGTSIRKETIIWQHKASPVQSSGNRPQTTASNSIKTKGEKENIAPITSFFKSGGSVKTATVGKKPTANSDHVVKGTCYVIEVNRRSNATERKKAAELLRHANQELSSADIPDNILWGSQPGGSSEQFKVYIYISGTKCVGLCLAEEIREAYLAQPDSSLQDEDERGKNKASSISCSLDISTEKSPALVGISRIWISPKYRRQGIASRLVTSAAENFIYGMKLGPNQVAFSQPTDSGAQFALDWVVKHEQSKTGGSQEDKVGFYVYMDSV